MPEPLYFLVFPAVGALVGWFTNWLAILMLFRPRKPFRILGWTLQGVVPSRHSQLAERIAQTVERDLLSHDDLERAMSGVRWHDEVHHLIRQVLHDRGPGGVIEKIPGISQAWRNIVLPSLEEVLSREVIRFIDGYRSRFIDRLLNSVQIGEIVREKVELLEMEAMESLVMSVARREFGHIQVVGAVTGAVVGLAQGLVLLLVG